MTKHWFETRRPSSTVLGPFHMNPDIFETASFFWHELAFFVHDETNESANPNQPMFGENARHSHESG